MKQEVTKAPAPKDTPAAKHDMKPADVPISAGSQNPPNLTENVIKRDELASILPTKVEAPKANAVGAAPKESPKGEQKVVIDEKHSDLKAEEHKKEEHKKDEHKKEEPKKEEHKKEEPKKEEPKKEEHKQEGKF